VAGQQATTELAVGAEFAGYRIEAVAARGGMGVVYRATQLRLKRPVALKLVTPALARDARFRERFRSEWMVAASIEHPNVIPVYEAGEEGETLYIAMRWVEGSDLREVFDQTPLEPARAVRIVSQVASALDVAHERGLIHRDVKPANVLITGDDHVYLTDFGLTKHASSISGLTKTGQWVGTVDYTAPEQIEGTTASPRADVYSLGCVLFEALTGRPPFKRENELATLWAHMYTPPPSLRDVSPDAPAGFDEVLQRAMAKDPDARYASAGELAHAARAAALEQAPEQMRTPAPAGETDRPGPRASASRIWRERRGRVAVVALTAVLAIAAVVAITSLGSSDEPGTESGATSSAVPESNLASDWRRREPMPAARQNMDGAVLDGTVWVVGGLGAGTTTSRRVEGYDPVINGWKTAPELPVKLNHEMVVSYKGELVVLGGWIPQGSDPSALTSDRVFALRSDKWESLPALRRPRAAGAAAVVGDRIVVVGGQDDGRLLETTEVFDGRRWTEGADIPTPRDHLAAVSDGDALYAVGGRALGPDKNSAALERYDPASDSWEELADMPTARGGLGAAISGSRLVAVGGESPTHAIQEVESYSIADGEWSSASPMRTPRHGLVVEAIGSAVYAFGGAPRPGHASASDVAEVTRLTR
jgi:serine/threonine protein kinase